MGNQNPTIQTQLSWQLLNLIIILFVVENIPTDIKPPNLLLLLKNIPFA